MFELVFVALISSYGNDNFRVEPMHDKETCLEILNSIKQVNEIEAERTAAPIIAYCRPKMEKEK